MLNQIMLTGPMLARVRDEPSHAIELMISPENEAPLLVVPPGIVLHLFLELVHKPAHQIEHAIGMPNLLPQVRSCVAVVNWWVPRPAMFSLVERQKLGCCAF